MDSLTIAAAAGMRSRMESLDLLANNLANTSAPGFKADRERFSLYLSDASAEAQADGTGVAQSLLPVIESSWTDTSQGELKHTGDAGDLALSGSGYLQVNTPDGPLFTRDGRFTVTQSGQVVSAGGFALASESGKPLQVDPTQSVDVDKEGMVRQQGVEVGRLRIVDWNSETPTDRRAGGYFHLDSTALSGLQKSSAQVQQGFQEQANLNPAQASVRLIEILRQFESLDKAAQIGDQMSSQTLQQVAHVG